MPFTTFKMEQNAPAENNSYLTVDILTCFYNALTMSHHPSNKHN